MLSVQNTVEAVSSMNALRELLINDLEEVSVRLKELERENAHDEGATRELQIHRNARTAILGGLASIRDVLSWVRLCTTKGKDGNELACVHALPETVVRQVN